MAPPPTTNRPDEGGRNLCSPTEGRLKAPGTGREEKSVDIRGHMETRRGESLRAPISCKGSVPHSEVGPRNSGKLEGKQATAGRGSRIGGGGATWVGHPTPLGSLAPYKGVVLVCGRPCSADRSGNTRADYGRAGGTVQVHPAPRGKYTHFCEAIPSGLIVAYGGKYQVGGETPTKSPLRRAFRDAGQAPERVASDGKEEGEGGGGDGGGDGGEQQGGGGSTKSTEAPNWEMVVELVQTAFREGRLAEEAI